MPISPIKPTRCGVNVLTWGTDPEGGNGMGHFLDTKLFGGNVGHAAIQLVFPANEEGDRLVKQYCEASETHAGLPVVKRHYVTPSAPSTNNTQTENLDAYSEEVYEVYWSWWPSADEKKPHGSFVLNDSIDHDQILEREGVHFHWDPKWAAIIEPEKRTHKGLLGEKQMHYSPYAISHNRNLNPQEKLALALHTKTSLSENKKNAMAVLEEKLNKKIETKIHRQLTKTEKTLLNKFIPKWMELLEDPQEISATEAKKLIAVLKDISKKDLQRKNTARNLLYLEDQELFFMPYLVYINEALENDASVQKMDITACLSQIEFYRDLIGTSSKEQIKLSELLAQEKEYTLDSSQLNFIKKLIERFNTVVETETIGDRETFLGYKAMSYLMSLSDQQSPDLEIVEIDPAMLDNLTPFLDNRSWRKILSIDDPNVSSLRIQQIQLLISLGKKIYQPLKTDKEELDAFLREKYSGNLQTVLQNYFSIGTPPDSTISLSMTPFSHTTLGNEGGLHIENMLKKMRELSTTDAESFDLSRKNCSKTSDSILEAGATEDWQKDFFRAKIFGFFGTPQETFNHAQLFQKALAQGKPGILRQALAFNPLQRMRGACVRQIMDKQNGRTQKTLAVMGLVLLSPFLAFTFSIKRILDPLGTFSMAARGFDFARSRQFRGSYKILQGFMLMGAGSLAAVLSPLALVQWILKTTLSNTEAFLKKSFSPKKMPATKNADSSETATDTLVAHERSLKEHAFSGKIKHLEIHIHEKHVADILHRFERILNHDKNAIPVLSKISENKLLAFIRKHPDHEVEMQYHQLSEKAHKRIIDVQKRLQAGESLVLTPLHNPELEHRPQAKHLLHALHRHNPRTEHKPHTEHHLHAFHTHTKVARPSEDQPTHTKPRKPIIPPRKPV